MTRKDYVAVAKVINDGMVWAYPNMVAMRAVQSIAIDLAAVFRQDNPRFDSAVFYAAASVRCYKCSNFGHLATDTCGNA